MANQPGFADHHPDDTNLGKTIADSLAQALRTPEELRGLHYTQRLPQPMEVPLFGRFDERLDYTRGCILRDELTGGTGIIALRLLKDDGTEKRVVIGATPHKYDSRTGGRQLDSAGEAGDYLLMVQEAGSKGATFRYMDGADVNNTMAVVGREVVFGPNEARQRQLIMPGQVQEIVGYR
jgi:hypothetical protein